MKTEKTQEFLKNYINAASPSGFEMITGGQQVWINQVEPYVDRVEVDSYGNAYATIDCKNPNPWTKTVLIDAHADEIGFVVSDITKKGFIKVNRLGGSDVHITPSARVNIWGEKGKINGVFGHPAIHIQGGEFKAEIHKLFIDIGVDSKEKVLEMGIEVGTPITMADGYMELGDYYCGRSLDDKIGGYITARLLKQISDDKMELPFNLVIVNAVQEEVGLFGAKMAANKIKPDVAIVIDVTHDTSSPAYDGPSIQKNLFKLLKDTAKDKEIKYQLTTSGRGSGTNADSYAYPQGIPTALIKMGMRYMHTTVETVHKDDVESAISLLYQTLLRPEMVKSFNF